MRVHDSQAYRKMVVTRERIGLILELREILLSFQTGFSLVNAAVVSAICDLRLGTLIINITGKLAHRNYHTGDLGILPVLAVSN